MTPFWVIFACFCVYSVDNAAVPTKTCTAIQNCDDCSNPALACTKCPAGYAIKSDGQKCLPCPDNCLSCNNTEAEKTVCLDCRPGYWLKSSDKTCEQCPSNCATCKEKGTTGVAECMSCVSLNGLKNDKTGCVPCSAMPGCTVCSDANNDNVADVCEQCSGLQGLRGDKKGCTACPTNCLTCTDADNNGKAECSVCISRFGLKPDKTGCATCSALGSECMTCTIGNDQTTPSSCDSCTGGYVVRGNKQGCSKCPDGCKSDKCSDSQGSGTAICEECVNQWGVKPSKAGCVSCNPNCNKCTVMADETTTKCTECVARYEKTNMNTCDFCPENCLICEISGGRVACKSSGCKPKYAWKSDDGTCVKCPVNCNECSYSGGVSKCRSGKCISGFTDRVSDGKCYQCPDRCSKCSDDGTKTKCGWQYCHSGSAWKGDDGSCPECPSGCQYCYADRDYLIKCSICKAKKTLSADRSGCSDCPINCNECELVDNIAKCLDQQCYDGYYRDENGQCKACSTGCKSCIKSGSSTTCLVCRSSYVMNPTSVKCVSCPSGCETGQCQFSSTKAVCAKCLKGFVRHTDGTCKGCPSNCDTCKYESSKTICTTCSAKHYHVQSQMCIACPPGCKSCYESGNRVICNPSACLSGYTYYGSKCYKCPPKCTSCTGSLSASAFKTVCNTNKCSGAYATDASGLCQPCSDNCESCTSPGKCSKCNVGYIISGTACEACAANCFSCSQVGKCSKCLTGFKLDNNECKECASKDLCETCDDQGAGRCDYCKLGHVVKDNSQTCLSCPAGCNYCEQESTASETTKCKPGGCKLGFAQKRDTICSECPPGCAECKYDATEATLLCLAGKCKHGYTESSGSCVRCADNCITCNAQGKCNERGCKSGYTRSSSGISCEKCADNCLQCDVKGPGKCDTNGCAIKFAYDNEACKACQPSVCQRCSKRDKCDNGACIGNYIWVAGDELCKACANNCKSGRCTTNGAGKCDECEANYVLDANKQCQKCDDNCEHDQCAGFSVAGKCNSQKCKAKYTWDADDCHACDSNCLYCDAWGAGKCDVDRCVAKYRIKLDTSIHTCEACSVSNCAKCVAAKATCEKCEKGYTLNGNKCEACASNCDYCDFDGKDTCDQGWCSTSYGWDTATMACRQCENSCTKCNKYGYDKCDSAENCPSDKGYDGTNHICLTCDINCKPGKCTAANQCSTDQCQDNFILSGSKTCEACGSDCKTCKAANDNTKCLSCRTANNFVTDLSAGSSCIACAANCNIGQCFTAGKCNKDQCMDGYMLAADYTCTECGSNCKTCSAANKCTSCMGNRFLKGEQCLACDPNCKDGHCSEENKCDSQQCRNNYKYKPDDQTCEKCHGDCATCAVANDATKCLTCSTVKSSKVPAGGECTVCDPNCKPNQCTVAGQCNTDQCEDGYASDSNICKPCHSDCKTCKLFNNAAQCKTCVDPTKGVKAGAAEGECIACDPNCQLGQCIVAGQCTTDKCKDGFASDGTACKPCHRDCATCSGHNDATKCKTCVSSGKGSSDPAAGGSCVECDKNCQAGQCTIVSKCNVDKCLVGYVSKTDGTCEECHADCTTCKVASDNTKCLSCPYPKTTKNPIDGGSCITCDTNCKAGECTAAGKCNKNKCKDNYIWQTDGTCAQCHADCKTCSVKDEQAKCITCVDSAKTTTDYVNGGSCVACHEFCKSGKCSSTGKCYGGLCKDRFFMNEDTRTCSACHSSCKTCFGNGANQCITCSSDRSLLTSSCILCHDKCMTKECTEEGSCKKNKCVDGYTNSNRDGSTVNDLACTKECLANCKRCDKAGENKCDKGMCKDAFVWISNGECAACGSNCKSCNTNGKDKCDWCMPGYTLDSNDKTCSACASNCLKCDKMGAGNCDYDQCKVNMIYDDTAKQCKACDTNCKDYQCYNSDRFDSKCNDDGCKTDLKIDTTDKKCKPCDSNCKSGKCTEPGTCSDGECNARYTSDGNKCAACSSNCKKCDVKKKGKCDEGECDVGYVWVNDACKKTMCGTGEAMNHLGSCITCLEGCLKCRVKTDNKTTECITGFCKQGYADNNGVCTKCPSNCDTCIYSQGVLKCSKSGCGYRYGYKDEACGQCAIGCEECSKVGSELACDSSKCLSNYAQVDSNKCMKCYRGCDTCTMNTQTNFLGCGASACSSGYTQLADKSCFSCPSYCNSCTYTESLSLSKCDSSKCFTGYVMNNADKSCNKCPTGCHKCSWTTTAVCDILQCKDGYVQNPVSKECKNCPSKCSSCFFDESTSDAKCYDKGCDINSYMSSGTCTSCNSNCHRCENIDGTKRCLDQKCSDNYGLKFNDRLCYACPEGCKHCDIATDGTPTCTMCQSGFAMKADDKTCKPCPDNCRYCDYDPGISDTKCQSSQCKTGFAQTDDNRLSCIACQTCSACTYNSANPSVPDCNDNTCPSRQQVQSSDKQCGKCPTNCLTCNGELKCTLCDSRYILQPADSQCIVCPADCHSCDSLGDGKSGCKSNGCNSGYVVTPEKLCQKCPENCLECTYDADAKKSLCKATRCASRYAITTDFQCMKCPDNCYDCLVGTGGKTECKENKCDSRYGWRSSDKGCHKCPDNCATCPESNGVLICDLCVAEYTLSNAECGACPRNCLKCSEEASEGLKCKECAPRHVLDDNKNCAACPSNCNKCNYNNGQAKCESCDSGYTLNTALTCTVCPSNCFKCEYKNSKAECTTCHNGYSINAQKGCSRCADVTQILNCDTCTNADSTGKGVCLSCVNGYSLKDDAKECLPCSDLKDCLKCKDQALLCDKCSSGYTLTPDKLNCGINCYTCNRSADCANDPKKSSENSTLCVPALGQTCWMHRFEENKVIEHERGCFNSTDCGSRYKNEDCQEANGKKECKKCCTGEKCNSQILPGTASHLNSNFLTVLIVLLLGVVQAVLN